MLNTVGILSDSVVLFCTIRYCENVPHIEHFVPQHKTTAFIHAFKHSVFMCFMDGGHFCHGYAVLVDENELG